MKYRKISSYKYQLVEPERVFTKDLPDIDHDIWVSIKREIMTISEGYMWDGATVAIDTEAFMRASLVHDALYQLIREGRLDKSYKGYADNLMHQICLEDGMSRIRAWYVYLGVKWGGGKSIKAKSKGEANEVVVEI